jgi:hypothetical protein
VAIGGLLGVFLIKKSEKPMCISAKMQTNEKKRHFLQSPKKIILPPMLRMNG